MSTCKVMLKSTLEKVKTQFKEYEDMEFEKRGDWILIGLLWNTAFWMGSFVLVRVGRRR